MILQKISNSIETASQIALIGYASIFIFLAVSGVFSVAIIWWLIDTLKQIWENGLVMTIADKMLNFVLR